MAYSYSGYSAADQAYLREENARAEAERLKREEEVRSDFLYGRGKADEIALYNRAKADEITIYNRAKADQLAAEERALGIRKTTETSNLVPSWSPPESYDVPEYTPYIPGAAPTYKAPKWDEGAIDALTQQKAAPGLRTLRQQVQRVTGRRYDNPQVGRMTLREALQGYGSGIGSVLGGAGEVALGEYGKRYGIEADVAKTNYGGAMARWSGVTAAKTEAARTQYQSELEKRRTAFSTAWDKWKASIGTRTTTSSSY